MLYNNLLESFCCTLFWTVGPWSNGLPPFDGNIKFHLLFVCREVMEAFSEEVKALDLKLLGVCAIGLGLKETYFKEALGGDPTFSIRINYYPPFPELKSRIVGVGEHSDTGGITVLLQGDIAGLQVRHANNNGSRWVDVKTVKNALVINIGDQLEVSSKHLQSFPFS
jgi:isopenicillin N synthase-like dioxygenase